MHREGLEGVRTPKRGVRECWVPSRDSFGVLGTPCGWCRWSRIPSCVSRDAGSSLVGGLGVSGPPGGGLGVMGIPRGAI